MQFELRRLVEYSDKAILDEIRRVAEIVNGPTLPRTAFQEHSRVSSTTISRRFGCWEKALEAAGLVDRFDSTSKRVSREEILSELERISMLLGTHRVSCDQFNAHARFTDAVVRREFGTWHRAMKAAGLLTNALGRRYTDEECFENLLSVWTHYGRPPKHAELKEPPSVVGPKAYTRRFGSWTRALQAFIDRVNADPVSAGSTCEPNDPERSVEKDQPQECDRREIRLAMRYTVLKRDRFRCIVCGRSPATHIGVALHVDHIVPVALGGKTILDNLRALCEDCNLGKGASRD